MKNKLEAMKNIVIIIFFIFLIIGVIKYYFIDFEQIGQDINEAMEGLSESLTCEFRYEGMYYKGLCDNNFREMAGAFIELDMTQELLELCMNSPNSHKYEICEDYIGE